MAVSEDVNDTIHVIVGYRVDKCDVTDTLLPHGAAEVSFQSAQRTEWSFCRTQCSRYHCKDMCHIRKLWKHIK